MGVTLAWVDWLLIVLYLIASATIAIWAGRTSRSNLTGFFTGSKSIPWYLAGLSMVATTFAADTPLAVTELTSANGISGNWLWWNMMIGGLLTTFFFAKLWKRTGVLTDNELLELRYSGKLSALLRGAKAIYLGFYFNILIIGWVNLALLTLLQVYFDMEYLSAFATVGGVMLLTAIYSSYSGLKGIVYTDVLQFCIAMLGSILLAVLVINDSEIGNLGVLAQKTNPDVLRFFPSLSSGSDAAGTLVLSLSSFLAYAAFQWWASYYPGAEPGGGGYVAQRMFSTGDEKGAFKATLLFQVLQYVVRPWPWIIVALATIVLYPAPQDLAGDELNQFFRERYVYAMRDYLPIGYRGLMLVAFLGAYMSTISTQLNWGASYLTVDLYDRFRKNHHTGISSVNFGKLSTIGLMIIGLVATLYMNSISGVWQFLLESGAGLGGVLILRWYWWRVNAWAELTAMVVPLLIVGVLTILQALEPELAEHNLFSFPGRYYLILGLTTLSWLLICLATPPTPHERLLQFYNLARPGGWWGNVVSRHQLKQDSQHLLPMAGAWIFSIIAIYGLLFGSGYFLFGQLKHSAIALSIAVVTGAVTYILLRKNIDSTPA